MDEIIGLFSLSHEQNNARFNYAMARKQRRMPIYTEFIRMFLRSHRNHRNFYPRITRKTRSV